MATVNLDDILIGIGLEAIPFGTTIDTLTKILGGPEEIEDRSHSISEHFIYNYYSRNISFFFDAKYGGRLYTIITRRKTARLHGATLIGLAYDEVVVKLTAMLVDEEIDEYKIEDRHSYVDRGYYPSTIRFWFADARLEHILWGHPDPNW